MTSLLMDTQLDSDQRDFTNSIRHSAEVLTSLINDILDFSKIEAGNLELESINYDLRALVETSVEVLAPKADEKGIQLRILIEPAVPLALRGDPGRLTSGSGEPAEQCRGFTQTGSVELHISARSGADNRRSPRYPVKFETPASACEDVQPRLFQPFMQADGSTALASSAAQVWGYPFPAAGRKHGRHDWDAEHSRKDPHFGWRFPPVKERSVC